MGGQFSANYKGAPIAAFPAPIAQPAASTAYVDCGGFNAVHVEAYVNATGASFDLYIEGSNSSSGVFLASADPAGTRAGITASVAFNVLVGASLVRARVANVSGTFAAGQGIQVWLTPYIAGGSNIVNIASTASQNLAQVGGGSISLGQTVSASSLPVVLASNQGTLAQNLTQVGGSAVALGATTAAASLPVVIANNQAAVPTYATSTTATVTSVAAAFALTQLLASNTARRGATVYNDSNTHVHVQLGNTASTTSFTVVLGAIAGNIGGYYEVPAGYTGPVSAYWGAASPTGFARVTEIV